jgi:nucleoside-diphosphate-sugar epimerase
MKSLVTGGTGFVGGYVAEVLLEEGHAVRVFTRRPGLPERLAAAEAYRGDLEEPSTVVNAMEGMDVVYHVGEVRNTSRAQSAKNLRLVQTIAEAAGEKGVKRLVFVSSITVAGIPREVPASEETEPLSSLGDHYTAYKREAERLLSESPGIEYSVIRPAPVYGPGSRFMRRVVDAVDSLGSLGFPFIGNAENLAPLVYVKDLARAIYLAGLKEGAAGQVMNLTDGLRHSWLDFLKAISEALGKKLKVLPLSPLALRFPSIFIDLFSGALGLELDLTHYVDYFSSDVFFNNSRARALLGWEPRYSLEEGVREMINSNV